MEAFIKDTRHRDHHDPELIARKFLCTQVPTFLDYEHVFPFVSDDLNSINFRAPNVLATYSGQKHIVPQLLSELLSGIQPPSNIAVFDDYVKVINPPKGKEALSFFLHGQRKKNLHEHVDALVEDPAERKRIYTAIQKYAVPAGLDRKEMTKAVGNYLADMPIGRPIEKEEEEDQRDEPAARDEYDEQFPIALAHTDPKVFHDEDHWENPVLKAFKIEAGLSTRFSSEKAIKQILLASCAPPDCAVDSNILGKYQTALPRIDTTSHTVDSFPIHYLDHVPSETIARMVATPQAQNLYHGLLVKPANTRELIKTLLLHNHPTLGKFIQVSKHYQKPEVLDAEIVKLLQE